MKHLIRLVHDDTKTCLDCRTGTSFVAVSRDANAVPVTASGRNTASSFLRLLVVVIMVKLEYQDRD